jgi:hypothetical protein
MTAMDRLAELADGNALLGSALSQLRDKGISNATADALVGVGVTDAELAEFLALAARDVPRANLFGLAISLPAYLDRRGAGREALEHCLEPGTLTADELEHVFLHMNRATTPEVVVWWHTRLTSVLRDDNFYHHFLREHLDVVLDRCAEEMAAYLLHPDRGPGRLNVDTFDLVLRRVADPAPYLRRWREWIWAGYFDVPAREGSEHARILYQILTERWTDERFVQLRQSAHQRLLTLLRFHEPARRDNALHHLNAMAEANYRGAEDIRREIFRADTTDPTALGQLAPHLEALAAVARQQPDRRPLPT